MRLSIRLVILLVVVMPSAISGSTLHVPGEYSTIQIGLDAARQGDTVLVADGIYFENLVWPATESIKLLSENGPLSTVVDGSQLSNVIRIETAQDTSTVISGFSIRNGEALLGGGLLLYAGSCPLIKGNVIYGNYSTGTGGGGIWAKVSYESYLLITDNEVYNNHTYCSGGGIHVQLEPYPEPSIVALTNNQVYNNIAGQGGGVDIHNGSGPFQMGMVLIQTNCIYDNTGVCEGGGLSLFGPVTISQCSIDGNTAPIGAGISNPMGGCTIISSQISGNIIEPSSPDYGALTIWEDLPQGMQACLVESTTISGNIGNGIVFADYLPSYPLLNVHYCNILDNTGYGIFGSLTDATYCWWGDPSGPGGAGPGTGDEVSEDILYNPWLTEMGVEGQISCTALGLSVYPSPFNESTAIHFELQVAGPTHLDIYDLSGRLVDTLVDDSIEAGEHLVVFDDFDLAPGVYLVRLQSDSEVASARLVLVR